MKKFNPYYDNKYAPSMDWIVKDSDPLIREKCSNVDLPLSLNDVEYIKKMVSYVDHSYNENFEKYKIIPGVAIAANQVGLTKKIIYLHFDDEFGIEKHFLLANPEIIEKSNSIAYLENGEGCLSVPESKNGIVPRSNYIKFKAYDLIMEKKITIEFSGYSAIVIQHELDHLEGHLYYDRINIINPNYVNEKWKKI